MSEFHLSKHENNKPREDVLEEVWLYMQENWKFKAETSEYFLLTKLDVTLIGHIIIAALFGWWLIFIPNLLYHFIMKKKKKIFKYSTKKYKNR